MVVSSVPSDAPYRSALLVKLGASWVGLVNPVMNLLQQFEQFYSDFKTADLAGLENLYVPAVRFRDPVREVVGTPQLRRYFSASRKTVEECRFEFRDRLNDEHQCFYEWRMHYRHPRLAGGQLLTLRGMSHLHFSDGLIVAHEDIYDMGAMVYEHVPVLRTGVRLLKQRLQEE